MKVLSSSKFPPLSAWEQLMQRLQTGSGSALTDQETLHLDALRIIANQVITIDQLLIRLCLLLPKIINVRVVIFLQGRQNAPPLTLTSNVSARSYHSVLERSAVLKIVSGEKLARASLTPPITLTPKTRLRQVATDYLGKLNDCPLIILVASTEPLSPTAWRIFQAINDIVRLRVANATLLSQIKREIEKFSTLTDYLSEGMVVTDRELRITLWNKSLHGLTGYSSDEAIGGSYQQVLKNTLSADWLTEIITSHEHQPKKNRFLTEFPLLTKRGERKWVSVSGSFLRTSADQQIDQVILIIRDVSHLKQLEQRKNEFISIATHELRTPITAVKGYLSLLARDRERLASKQQLYLNRATEATDRLTRLAEDLLRVVQIEEDRLEIDLQPVEIYPLLEKVIRDFTAKAEHKNLRLMIKPADFSTTILADYERLEQVFANLIDNAIKYTAEGMVEVKFEQRGTVGQGRQITVIIKDTGMGISAKRISEVFEKFHRLHRPEQVREQGAGLGLYIVKSFVTLQGGKITVRSKLGRGTVFFVTFPEAQVTSLDKGGGHA